MADKSFRGEIDELLANSESSPDTAVDIGAREAIRKLAEEIQRLRGLVNPK